MASPSTEQSLGEIAKTLQEMLEVRNVKLRDHFEPSPQKACVALNIPTQSSNWFFTILDHNLMPVYLDGQGVWWTEPDRLEREIDRVVFEITGR
jgi:hypothetical protein